MSDHQQDRRYLHRKSIAGLPRKRLVDIELVEVSIVDVPANTSAKQLLRKHLHSADAVELDAGALDKVVTAAVAKALAGIRGTLDRANAAADRVAADTIAKTAGDDVAEAVGLARARADKPAQFWRAALARLGQQLAPGAPPTAQLQAAMADPRGRLLVQALNNDFRELRG
jgi:hypothetical protein